MLHRPRILSRPLRPTQSAPLLIVILFVAVGAAGCADCGATPDGEGEGEGTGEGEGEGEGEGGLPALPTFPDGAFLDVDTDAAGTTLTATWPAALDDGGVTGYVVTVAGGAPVEVAGLSFQAPAPAVGALTRIEVFAVDADDNRSDELVGHGTRGPVLPAAPPLPPGAGFADRLRFLEGLQPGLDIDALAPHRVALVSGTVRQADGTGVEGVDVHVRAHPELGQTLSRADGRFDLVVEGGGAIDLELAHPDFLVAQREVNAPWEGSIELAPVTLVRLDSRRTVVELGASAPQQVHVQSRISDGDGTRQARVTVPAGTTATLVLPDGTEQQLDTLTLRVTEFTVGDGGGAAMPAPLPSSTLYTYAVEITADEALLMGGAPVGSKLRTSARLPLVVENFVGVPVGSQTPIGVYDREAGVWIDAAGLTDGSGFGPFGVNTVRGATAKTYLVVEEVDGKAQLDADGDGDHDAEDQAALEEDGVLEEDLEDFAEEFEPGDEITFTPDPPVNLPIDLNHPPYEPVHDLLEELDEPFREDDPAEGEDAPGGDTDPAASGDEECEEGSIIGIETRTLSQEIELAGSPLRLRYDSDRAARASAAARTLHVPLVAREKEVDARVRDIVVNVSVAGQHFQQSFTNDGGAFPDEIVFAWDGLDGWGRSANFTENVAVDVAYAAVMPYAVTTRTDRVAVFGESTRPGASPAPSRYSSSAPQQRRIWRGTLGGYDAKANGLAGWTLSVHHVYDRVGRTLHQGDGKSRSASSIGFVVDTAAGTGAEISDFAALATPLDAQATGIGAPRAVAGLADGGFLMTIGNGFVMRVDANGVMTKVAGGGSTAGNDIPATEAVFAQLGPITAGPDGSVYIGDEFSIRRVRPDGVIELFAGTGAFTFLDEDPQPGYDALIGDGVHRLQAQVFPEALAVGPDGAVYVGDASRRIRRIGPEGIVTTVAGNNDIFDHTIAAADRVAALETPIGNVQSVAVTPDGSLVIGAGSYVRRIDPSGLIETIAGSSYESPASSTVGEGGDALSLELERPFAAVALDGTVFIGDSALRRVLTVDERGIARRIAGGGQFGAPVIRGAAGTAVDINPTPLDVLPDGTVLVADATVLRVRALRPALPSLPATSFAVPSSDGLQLFVFDSAGKHQSTLSTLSGAALWSFTYDEAGLLTSLVDEHDRVTSVERAADGTPLAIVAPGGARTTLTTDAAGYLASVTRPGPESVTLTSTPDGLLETLRRGTGADIGVHTFTYDEAGALVTDTSPTGRTTTLAREQLVDGYEVTRTTASGLVHTTRVAIDGGTARRTRIGPDDVVRIDEATLDGTRTIQAPDGSTTVTRVKPDPRFGMLAPFAATIVRSAPSGLTSTYARSRTATLADARDPLSLLTLVDLVDVNGARRTLTWDAQARTVEVVFPSGRRIVRATDDAGNALTTSVDGLAPRTWSRDAQGRVTGHDDGDVAFALAWGEGDRLIGKSTPRASVSATHDAAGRLATTTTAGAQAQWSYDDRGLLVGRTSPEGVALAATFDEDGALTSTAVAGAVVQRDYDDDGRLDVVTLPSGATLTWSYDGAGRLSSIDSDDAVHTLVHDDVSGRLAQITRTPTGGLAQSIAWSYDGPLVAGLTFAGAAAGSFTYGRGPTLHVTSIGVTSGGDTQTILMPRDDEGLVTALGAFAVTRGPHRMPTRFDDGTRAITHDFTPGGRLAARAASVAGTTRYEVSYQRDEGAQLVSRTETVQGVTVTAAFTRDAFGQLVGVAVNPAGAAADETYTYDDDGNRLSKSVGGVVSTATYDARGRIATFAGDVWSYDDDDRLAQRGDDVFVHGAGGELLAADVGGVEQSYAYDTWGRRTARIAVDGVEEYLYGDPALPMRPTHVRGVDGVLTTLLWDERGNLVALERAGERFLVGTDLVGSPRVVLAGDGSVVRQIERDAFGAVLADSNPAFFLPIGFAGGILDPLTGFVRFGLRDYDPASGRFLSRDPAFWSGGEGNLFVYAHNDPVCFIDIAGLASAEASAYAIFGGGGSLTFDPETGDASLCLEIGLGFSAPDVDFDLFDNDVADGGTSVAAEAEIGFGPFGAELSAELSTDGCLTTEASAHAGPINLDGDGVSVSEDPDDWSLGDWDLDLSATLSARHCFSTR